MKLQLKILNVLKMLLQGGSSDMWQCVYYNIAQKKAIYSLHHQKEFKKGLQEDTVIIVSSPGTFIGNLFFYFSFSIPHKFHSLIKP